MAIGVLLVDDEDLVRRALRAVLDTDPEIEVIDEVRSVREGVEKLADEPNVAVLIVGTVDDAAIEAARMLCSAGCDGTPVLALVSRRSNRLAELIDAGASGLMLKSATPAELICAVRITAAGYAVLAPEIGEYMRELMANASPSAQGGDVRETLSAREYEVLDLLAHGKTNAEIAEALVVTPATVKSHIQRIFGKLALRDRTQAAIFAYEAGLIHPGKNGSHNCGPQTLVPARR